MESFDINRNAEKRQTRQKMQKKLDLEIIIIIIWRVRKLCWTLRWSRPSCLRVLVNLRMLRICDK